jgi:hypothetical protein
MMTRFKVKDLMINVASKDERGCPEGQSDDFGPGGGPGGGSNCGTPSCIGEKCPEVSFNPATNCDKPTCKGPAQRRQARGRDELAGGNLALLQQELRTALSQPGQGA